MCMVIITIILFIPQKLLNTYYVPGTTLDNGEGLWLDWQDLSYCIPMGVDNQLIYRFVDQ